MVRLVLVGFEARTPTGVSIQSPLCLSSFITSFIVQGDERAGGRIFAEARDRGRRGHNGGQRAHGGRLLWHPQGLSFVVVIGFFTASGRLLVGYYSMDKRFSASLYVHVELKLAIQGSYRGAFLFLRGGSSKI